MTTPIKQAMAYWWPPHHSTLHLPVNSVSSQLCKASQNKCYGYLNIWVHMHFRCRVWQVQILDVIQRVLLLQHCSNLYEVTFHKKNAAHRHLWHSCRLLRRVAIQTPVRRETSCTRAIWAQTHSRYYKMTCLTPVDALFLPV